MRIIFYTWLEIKLWLLVRMTNGIIICMHADVNNKVISIERYKLITDWQWI